MFVGPIVMEGSEHHQTVMAGGEKPIQPIRRGMYCTVVAILETSSSISLFQLCWEDSLFPLQFGDAAYNLSLIFLVIINSSYTLKSCDWLVIPSHLNWLLVVKVLGHLFWACGGAFCQMDLLSCLGFLSHLAVSQACVKAVLKPGM